MVWAVGRGPLFNANGVNITDESSATYGFQRTRLLKVDDSDSQEFDSFPMEITHKVDLKDDDTTYWCSSHKLPDNFNSKHHAIKVFYNLKFLTFPIFNFFL